MRKFIDQVSEPVTEIAYRNKANQIETVNVEEADAVSLHHYTSTGDYKTDMSSIYYDDIPHMILALQEAYDMRQRAKAPR